MTPQEFIKERAQGAAKIAKEAQALGGLALLTATHFKAKGPAYAQALLTLRVSDTVTRLKILENEAAEAIPKAKTMSDFQKQTGRQEVFGEVICFLEHL